jgi:hypothetical protein
MSLPSENIRELEEAISSFLTSFELVFDNDWDMTKGSLVTQLQLCHPLSEAPASQKL